MPTIQDVINKTPRLEREVVNKEYDSPSRLRTPNKDDLAKAFRHIGDLFAEERGLSLGEARKLPRTTRLGLKSERAFQELLELRE